MGMMLQRFCTRFHHVASVTCATNLTSSVNPLLSTPIRLFHSPTSLTTASLLTLSRFPVKRPTFFLPSPFSPHSQINVRWKTKVTRARAPYTPVKSKKHKYKIKGYSSYKRRFKALHDGTIRRWKEGNAHNAFCKSQTQKRRLRLPALVSPAYATVMKKLHFFG
ncbi:hypothetical protein ZOSMA_60G00460 [Zostera marina]|uniref:50S ribosomal protein L35 n=1 Tax=Zostera marina TaxID=29655 RepID=A0A0K9NVN1_ZOSMR|nr:hypothetical protein ZOSMA_60G00460 [Zostera marina]